MICHICRKDARLILNTCAECDPELHAAWNKAVKSYVDNDTITPEMKECLKVLQDRKMNGWGQDNPAGILNVS